MLDIIKTKLWDILKEKEVSLAMVYDREGRILWHKGREIIGKTIQEGEGFSKSFLIKSLQSGEGIDRENVIIASSKDTLPQSAYSLLIKGILVQPIEKDLFLYIDSGTKESFNAGERGMFRMLGDMLAETVRRMRDTRGKTGGVSGSSGAMDKIRQLMLKFSLVEEPILLKGETGVGKNHMAEQIHRNSGRKGKFVVVHTPSIQESLFESEIFGHKKGAFTDAKNDRKGLVAEADGGTLFFDEISEVPLTFQTKLLRFIETKKYRILGESMEREADVRIITATNRDLHQAIVDNVFREDLYFRLHVLEIDIPPLRERKDDIRELVTENNHLLLGKVPGDGFWKVILNYDWPGNVRELFTVLKRAGIMLNSPITGEDIQAVIKQGVFKHSFTDEQGGAGSDPDQEIWDRLNAGKSFWDVVKTPFLDRDLNRPQVKAVIARGLAETGGKYHLLLERFNLKPSEYKKLMNFLHKNRLQE
jgi:DNA-binding NtrC family response regulator